MSRWLVQGNTKEWFDTILVANLDKAAMKYRMDCQKALADMPAALTGGIDQLAASVQARGADDSREKVAQLRTAKATLTGAVLPGFRDGPRCVLQRLSFPTDIEWDIRQEAGAHRDKCR